MKQTDIFFVAAESQKELEKGNYIAQVKVAKSELNHYPKLKYIPEGTHYLYAGHIKRKVVIRRNMVNGLKDFC